MTELIRLPLGMVNCYLLRFGENAILVDTATYGSRQNLVAALERYATPPARLRMVFLTHNHPDHSGAAQWLRQTYGLPLALHPQERRPAPLKTVGASGLLLGAFSRAGVSRTEALDADIKLEDGMSLKEYGIPAQVLHLPGHTLGSVGILLDGKRFLCGDMYMNLAGPRLAPLAEDFEALCCSEKKLLKKPVDVVFPGHGSPFRLARLATKAEENYTGQRLPCGPPMECAGEKALVSQPLEGPPST